MVNEVLRTGAENARTGREICDQLQIKPRDFQIQVEKERRAGIPICASSTGKPGYFLAANKAELKTYSWSLTHREQAIRQTRQALLSCMDQLAEA